jgi:hypothetical protein
MARRVLVVRLQLIDDPALMLAAKPMGTERVCKERMVHAFMAEE